MSKTSQSIIVVAALILLIGAGGCGLRLVNPSGTSSDSEATTNSVADNSTAPEQTGDRLVAQRWIESSSPTYKFDGDSLKFMQSSTLRCPNSFRYEFVFESRNGGYGNRVNEQLDGTQTAHTIQITVENGEVISAIADGKYNEITGQFGEPLTDTTAPESERCG